MANPCVEPQRELVLATAPSSLTKKEIISALALREAGSTQPKALALVLEKHELNMDDAIALIHTNGQPAAIDKLLLKGFKTEQVMVVYDANEHIGVPLALIADFAAFFLGTDFTEGELLDAISAAEEIFPNNWDRGRNVSGPITYALGMGRSTGEKSIETLAENEFVRKENNRLPKEERPDFSSDEGQGDF